MKNLLRAFAPIILIASLSISCSDDLNSKENLTPLEPENMTYKDIERSLANLNEKYGALDVASFSNKDAGNGTRKIMISSLEKVGVYHMPLFDVIGFVSEEGTFHLFAIQDYSKLGLEKGLPNSKGSIDIISPEGHLIYTVEVEEGRPVGGIKSNIKNGRSLWDCVADCYSDAMHICESADECNTVCSVMDIGGLCTGGISSACAIWCIGDTNHDLNPQG